MNREFTLITIIILVLLIPGSNSTIQASITFQRADNKHAQTVNSPFIGVEDGHFVRRGKPYYFAGVNFWQGMNLAVDGPSGNREQLLAELDHLQELGITNLRVMASSEGPNTEPYRMTPALMISPGEYDDTVIDGLDFLLAEMGKRDMFAVMVLNNYWQWSGGMAQYVSWSTGEPIPYPGDWNQFMNFSAQFYDCDECQTWYRDHIAVIINRENNYNGLTYAEDPTIFSWELANEPRRYPDRWIDETAGYIKSLDPNHMVTTGSEGTPPWEQMDFTDAHDGPDIDYATIHVWPENWGWYDPRDPDTYEGAEAQALDYVAQHVALAEALGKPLVVEEFGLARDWEPVEDLYDPASTTTYRDRFYTALFDAVERAAAGDNIWVWSGQAQPSDPWVGDPPHETPGWYSVYADDESTLAIISEHAHEMISGSQK